MHESIAFGVKHSRINITTKRNRTSMCFSSCSNEMEKYISLHWPSLCPVKIFSSQKSVANDYDTKVPGEYLLSRRTIELKKFSNYFFNFNSTPPSQTISAFTMSYMILIKFCPEKQTRLIETFCINNDLIIMLSYEVQFIILYDLMLASGNS